MAMTSDIDFVMPWVDGSDPEWQKRKSEHLGEHPGGGTDNGAEHFREWGTLPYWFRAVEKYAPWVRKIHFITCGQVPEWLNLNHPKLHFVRHEDYIPGEWLPVFSSRPIELNIHRINGLSEQFVYFNDDMFINAPVKPEDFFVGGLPCSTVGLHPGPAEMGKRAATCVVLNDVLVAAENFDFREEFRKCPMKWLSPRYGMKILVKTLLLLPFMRFTGFHECHSANSYLKSTFIEVWEKEHEQLERTCARRFRDFSDVNQWVMEYWQMASGKFYPRSPKFSAGYGGGKGTPTSFVLDDIRHHRHKVICINDSSEFSHEEFEEMSRKVREAFSEVLPEKSAFEL